jgi:hypothetical protein
MAVDFNDFTTKASFSPTDKLVGYDQNASGGEKTWTYNTLLTSVSADMTPQLNVITGAPKYNSFSTVSQGSVDSNDFIVGYDNLTPNVGGERKWNIATLANAISGLIETELTNKINTNMQNIGNYPYLEYAWVTAPNAVAQVITNSNTPTALTINSEVSDSNGNGDIGIVGGVVGSNTGLTLNANEFGLKAGTYHFRAGTTAYETGGTDYVLGVLGLYNITDGTYVSRSGDYSGIQIRSTFHLQGQFTIAQNKKFSLMFVAKGTNGSVSITNSTPAFLTFDNSSPVEDQRTTIKLWKVG